MKQGELLSCEPALVVRLAVSESVVRTMHGLYVLQENTSRHGDAGTTTAEPAACSWHHAHGYLCWLSFVELLYGAYFAKRSCRWFVLKQGKIYWFKSDVVTPVGAAKL